MAQIDALRRHLPEVEASGRPVLTVSLDLSHSVPDGQPSARRVLRQGLREAIERYGDLDNDAKRSVDADVEAVEGALDDAIQRGARGFFYVGSAERGLRIAVETPRPFRNSIRVYPGPWLFEIERYGFLEERPVCIVSTDLHTMEVRRIRYGLEEDETEVDYDQHFLTRRGGRNDTQGTGGGPAGGPSGTAMSGGGLVGGGSSGQQGGWHSKNRVERSVEAHRQMFAREAAVELEQFLVDDDVLLVTGADEARSQLLNQLPESLRDRAIEAPTIAFGTPDRELVDRAAELARDEQFRRAELEVVRWFDGAFGERAVGGRGGVRRNTEEGRLGVLVLHEDVVEHLGTAEDARRVSMAGDTEGINSLLRVANERGVETMFTRNERVLREQEGVIGVNRW